MKSLLFATGALFLFSFIPIQARVGLSPCARVTAVANSIEFHDDSEGDFEIIGYSDFYYKVRATVRKLEPYKFKGSQQACESFYKYFAVGKSVGLTIEVDSAGNKMPFGRGQEFTAAVDSSGYAYLNAPAAPSSGNIWQWVVVALVTIAGFSPLILTKRK
jgi:hypothetical protein